MHAEQWKTSLFLMLHGSASKPADTASAILITTLGDDWTRGFNAQADRAYFIHNRRRKPMSLLYSSKLCYSNEKHYDAELDTFEMSQQRQLKSFINELIHQQWLSIDAEQRQAHKVSADRALTAPSIPMSTIKEQGSNLLQFTKTKALQNLRHTA